MLVLEITREENRLKMSAFQKAERDEATLRHYSECIISSKETETLCNDVINLLSKANRYGQLSDDLALELKKIGRLLFDQLLAPEAKQTIRTTGEGFLLFSLDEQVVQIPWEFLHDGSSFLCLKFACGRIVKTKQRFYQGKLRSSNLPIKTLILSDPTGDLSAAYQEGIALRDQLEKLKSSINVHLKTTDVDAQFVKKNILDYDIVHFSGHADYDVSNPMQGGWILKDSKFSSSDIVALGSGGSFPILVFSNGCQSGRTDEWKVGKDFESEVFGLANAFLLAGVKHYIGTFWRILDKPSVVFAKEFYRNLTNKISIGEAIRFARIKLLKEYGESSIIWASYMLYGDPTFTLSTSTLTAPGVKRSILKNRYKQILIAGGVVSLIICTSFLVRQIPPRDFGATWDLYLQGKNEEVIRICTKTLEKNPHYLTAYKRLGETYERLGDWAKALDTYFKYLTMSEKRGDKKNQAEAFLNIGWTYQSMGNYQKAEEFYNKGIELSKQIDYPLGKATGYRRLGLWYLDEGDNNKARALFTKAMEINRLHENEYQHKYDLASGYFDMAIAFNEEQDYDTAKEYYKRSKEIYKKANANEIADYYTNMGAIFQAEKEYFTALSYYQKGIEADRKLNNTPGVGIGYNLIGELYFEMGNLDEAQINYEEALKIRREINDVVGVGETYRNLGNLFKKKGDITKAKEFYEKALEIYTDIDSKDHTEVKKELDALTIPIVPLVSQKESPPR